MDMHASKHAFFMDLNAKYNERLPKSSKKHRRQWLSTCYWRWRAIGQTTTL